MRIAKNILLLLFISSIAIGCDKVTDPFETSDGPTPPTEGVTQKVLLEDMTGYRCTNCPAAAAVANQLSGIYGENLIVVGIHCTSQFAAPTGATPDDPYYNDYRTEAGETYVTAFNLLGLPNGLVNRTEFNGQTVVNFGDWAEAIEVQLEQSAKAEIKFENTVYNTSTRTVTFDVNMEVLEDMDAGQYFMTLYLTEDSIYDWQYNNGVDVENYLHRHVLRDNINGTWGVLAFTSGASGQTNTLSYQYTLDEDWNEEHCEIVAYLYREDTRSVMQVESEHVVGP
jgi:hypothetical protein